MPDIDQDSSFCCASGKPIRALPFISPSERLGLYSESRMQVDAPEWRGTLEETMKLSKTRIVAETLNHQTLSEFSPNGSCSTPKIVLDALSNDPSGAYYLFASNQKVLDEYESNNALKDVLERDPQLVEFSSLVFNQLVVEIGIAMMDHLPGPHFTFIDPCLALAQEGFDRDSSVERAVHKIIEHARGIHGMFMAAGIDRHRVIIGIPATQCGIPAAAKLEGEYNISTNLYLISGLMHAIACAEVHPAFITIDIAAILAEFEESGQLACTTVVWEDGNVPVNHPGVTAIQSIVRYYKMYMIKTMVIGRNFRSAHEVSLLGIEFDVLSLSPAIMQELRKARLPLCVSGFSSEKPTFSETSPSQARDFAIPIESTASQLARAAPALPTNMVLTQDEAPNGQIVSLNVDWVHSETFMNPPALLESPRPFVLFSSITLTSLGRITLQTKDLRSAVEQSARHRVELRVLPLPELYKRAHGFQASLRDRYTGTPPPQRSKRSSRPVKKQKTLKQLGNGLPSSSIPIPHRPSPGAKDDPQHFHSSTPSPDTSTNLVDLRTGSGVKSSGYASDTEVAKIIALTFGAHILSNKTIDRDRAVPEGELATFTPEVPGLPTPETMGADMVRNDAVSENSHSIAGRSPGMEQGVLTSGQCQAFAMDAVLKEREELGLRGSIGVEDVAKDVQTMVEGVDFF